ncbi:hypothetical protein ACFLTJ_02420 [Chloroflexota bacterium]
MRARLIVGIACSILAAVLLLLDIPSTTPAPAITILIVGIALIAMSRRGTMRN